MVGGAISGLAEDWFTAIDSQTNGWISFTGSMRTNRLVTLQTSTNLLEWTTSAVLDHRTFQPDQWYQLESTNQHFHFIDPIGSQDSVRFYRFILTAFAETNDWKNQILFPKDAFANEPAIPDEPKVRWLKFLIFMDQPGRVYYQDSQKYLLHQHFAAAKWPRFANLSTPEFDRISLYNTNRQILLGTVLLPPREGILEYGVQFSARDPIPRELVRQSFELVRSTILAGSETGVFYFPSFEQTETAAVDASFFAAHGIRVSTVNRWLEGNQVYASGWALGTGRFLPASDIATAYAEGRLRPQDILLTDGVPAELPFVAGIMTTTPATPNSHVAIMAGAYGIPFAYVAETNLQSRLRELDGREVVLQASVQEGYGRISVIPVDGTIPAALRAELLGMQRPAEAEIKSKAHLGAYHGAVDGLWLDDICYFGGKASQYGLLRRTIPQYTPEAIAFSFDLWDDFMAQPLPTGRSLGEEIQKRLAGFTYPPDMQAVKTNLAAIRTLITDSTLFTPAQQQSILAALAPFDPQRNIRFRSSSNAEDAQTFAAAGLYDSYSGCLADDLDGDSAGPCRCDPQENKERGVFRAIRKVYASFYNDNAYLERLRHGIDEAQVGMALLVHHSTPDDLELANGVATITLRDQGFFGVETVANLVTQKGAVSVANPEGNAKPEIVEITPGGAPMLLQASSLVPLGEHVLEWEDEYATLADLLFQVHSNYVRQLPVSASKSNLVLDLEYKKVTPENLQIKQVRSLPPPAMTAAIPYLLNESTSYWLYQREGIDVFANHHLKCFLTLQTYSGAVVRSNLNQTLYTQARLEFRRGTNRIVLEGAPSTWPEATHTVTFDERLGFVVTDTWIHGSGADLWRFELVSTVPATATVSAPFLPQGEIRKRLRVAYATPMPKYDSWNNRSITEPLEEIQLIPCPDLASLAAVDPVRRTSGNVEFEIRFLESTQASGPPVGADKSAWGYYLAALSPWAQARISGLLAEPVVLRDYYATSASPGHKNLTTWYLFEPRLDPDLPPSQLEELRNKDIELIYLQYDIIGNRTTVMLMGANGKFRPLAP